MSLSQPSTTPQELRLWLRDGLDVVRRRPWRFAAVLALTVALGLALAAFRPDRFELRSRLAADPAQPGRVAAAMDIARSLTTQEWRQHIAGTTGGGTITVRDKGKGSLELTVRGRTSEEVRRDHATATAEIVRRVRGWAGWPESQTGLAPLLEVGADAFPRLVMPPRPVMVIAVLAAGILAGLFLALLSAGAGRP